MGHVASFTYAKINAFDYNNLSLRSQFANWLWQSASPMHRTKAYFRRKENGFPRRFDPRNDRGGLYIALSFT